jgi:DNA-binding GntR family transcriptional regulator
MALIERMQTINSAIADAVAQRDAVGYIRTNLEFHRTLYLRAHAGGLTQATCSPKRHLC